MMRESQATQSANSREQTLCTCTLEDVCSFAQPSVHTISSTISGVIFKCKAHDMDKMCTNTILPKQSINKINDSGLKCLNIYLYV